MSIPRAFWLRCWNRAIPTFPVLISFIGAVAAVLALMPPPPPQPDIHISRIDYATPTEEQPYYGLVIRNLGPGAADIVDIHWIYGNGSISYLDHELPPDAHAITKILSDLHLEFPEIKGFRSGPDTRLEPANALPLIGILFKDIEPKQLDTFLSFIDRFKLVVKYRGMDGRMNSARFPL